MTVLSSDARNLLLQKLDIVSSRWQRSRLERIFRYPFVVFKYAFYNKLLGFVLDYFPSFNPPKKLVKTFFGERILITTPPYSDILTQGVYLGNPEIRLTKFLIRHIKKDSVFFDVGAHYGYYSLLVSTLSSRSRIFAFEPHPRVLTILQKNKRHNISIIPKALSDHEQSSALYAGNLTYSGLSTLNADSKKAPYGNKLTESYAVQTTTLDTFCSNHKISPTIMKIDVEGEEYKVLKGAERILDRYTPIILMEVWFRPFSDQYKRALSFLEKKHYSVFAIHQQGTLIPLDYKEIPNYFSYLSSYYRKIYDLSIGDNLVFIKDKHKKTKKT